MRMMNEEKINAKFKAMTYLIGILIVAVIIHSYYIYELQNPAPTLEEYKLTNTTYEYNGSFDQDRAFYVSSCEETFEMYEEMCEISADYCLPFWIQGLEYDNETGMCRSISRGEPICQFGYYNETLGACVLGYYNETLEAYVLETGD